jgi:hypothetical protein
VDFYWLTVGTLAVWRLTHLLQAEDGPWDVVVRLRRAAGTGFWGGALDCFQCSSVWIAAPFALWLGDGWGERLLLWLALSAGAILLERIPEPASTAYFEGEADDVVLRTEEKGRQLGARESSLD